jgi:hypothetical protein
MMKKIVIMIALFIACFSQRCDAFDMVSGIMMNNMDSFLDQQEDRNLDTMTEEQKMVSIQANIIETMFLKTLLEEDPILQMNKEEREAEEGEEDVSVSSMTSEYSFYNKMMSRELAKKLAQKDLLKMTERFKNRGQVYNIKVPLPQGEYE